MIGIPAQRQAREPCAVEPCTIPGRHADACDAVDCRGCLPGLATVGRLCAHHHRRLERDIREAPAVWQELTVRLGGHDGHGQRVSGTRTPGLALNERVVAARDQLRHDLAWLCREVADHRGFSTPSPDVPSMVVFLLRSVDWLAHRPNVAEMAGGLAESMREARGQAFPSGRRRIPVADCAQLVACDVVTRAVRACPGRLWSPLPDSEDDLLPDLTCDTCGRTVAPAVWARGKGLVLSIPLASTLYGVPVSTLWRWVKTGRLASVEGDPIRVRAAEVERCARALAGRSVGSRHADGVRGGVSMPGGCLTV